VSASSDRALGEDRPLILVTNDDGVMAPGLRALAEAARPLGDVVVLAPDRNRSGVSHMISLLSPLRAQEVRERWWMVDGSPADCVYLGVHELLPRRPDVVLSGVNAGPNMSFDVHYSGTVGAAMEATLLGVPAVAASLVDPRRGSFEIAARFAAGVAERILKDGLPSNVTLNINVPGGAPTAWQATFLGHRLFRHSVYRRDDPRGGTYYWIGGVPAEPHDIPGSDCNAVAEGMISLTPLSVDLTANRHFRDTLEGWQFESAKRVQEKDPPDDMAIIPVR
jgi:5'-nucleotidase